MFARTSARLNPCTPRWPLGLWTICSPASTWPLSALHFPEYGRDVFAHPYAKADVAKGFSQAPSIPGAGAQVDRAVRTAAIAIVAPILLRERGDVERGPAQVAEVRNGACRLCVRQILQNVIANHQVERIARPEVRHRT